MTNQSSKKVLVKRPTRITTDGHGRSVWVDPVESAHLELVSTQMLKQMLCSRDDADRKAIADAATTNAEGVLARHPETGLFEIIDDDELKAILDANQDLPQINRPADTTLEPLRDYADDAELSLVSTLALRKVLRDDAEETESDDLTEVDDGGFNPYDNS